MYTKEELANLLHSLLTLPAETEIVEFKKVENTFSDTDLGEYFSALANEANLKGVEMGWLVFGVENGTHKVLGTNYKSSRPSLDEMKKKVADQTTNRITFDEIYEVTYEGKRVVMFQIPAAPKGLPIAFKGHFYGRDGESLVALNLHEIELIRAQTNALEDWSAEIVSQATINDLDPNAIAKARENYANKHEHLREDLKSWSDIEFLNRAKVTRNGKITNTAIILLGKSESEVLISPAVSKLRWIVKDSQGVELDYEICSCPMILAVDRIYSHIRNLKYRMINPALQSLFPEEMETYEPYVIREAINNAIAHQDYSMGGMINVVEFEDKLVFTNLGSFIPGSIKRVLESDAPEESYHNRFLANAMVELKMVDTIGSGIKRMFGYQKRRLFPMPDYDFSDHKVKLTIIGKVLDVNYANQLARNSELTLVEIELLNRVQFSKELSKEEVSYLRKKGLVEGRKGALVVSKMIAEMSGMQVDYSKRKGLSNEKCEALLLSTLKDHRQLSKSSIVELLWDILPNILTDSKKQNKINNLLKKLKKEGKIDNIKQGNKSDWYLTR